MTSVSSRMVDRLFHLDLCRDSEAASIMFILQISNFKLFCPILSIETLGAYGSQGPSVLWPFMSATVTSILLLWILTAKIRQSESKARIITPPAFTISHICLLKWCCTSRELETEFIMIRVKRQSVSHSPRNHLGVTMFRYGIWKDIYFPLLLRLAFF